MPPTKKAKTAPAGFPVRVTGADGKAADRILARESLAARFVPETLDPEQRTVDLVWTTGARVRRSSFWMGDWVEELAVDGASIRMDRLNNRASLLDTHDGSTVRNVLGVVERAWVADGEGRATVRFSKRADVEAIFADVRDGIIGKVSVGYARHAMSLVEETDDAPPVYRVTDWEPLELSLVGVPADDDASVRQHEQELEIETAAEAATASEGRTMEPVTAATPATPAAPAELTADQRAAIVQDERKRAADIRAAARAVGVDEATADGIIERGLTLDAARAEILAAVAAKQAKVDGARATAGDTGADVLGKRLELALSARVAGKPLDGDLREFRGMRLLDLARMSLESHGVRTSGMSPMELAREATSRMFHTASDFPLLLANVLNKQLRAAYDAAPQTFKDFGKRVDVSDFRSIHSLQVGNFPALAEVNEHGEFQRGTVAENDETYRVRTFGAIVGLSRQALINDDLRAFDRITQTGALAGRNVESKTVWDLIAANPTMSDGKAFFHADHGNLAGSAQTVNATGVALARKALRSQLDLNGQPTFIVPAFIVVGPEKETEAEQFLSPLLYAAQTSNVIPANLRSLRLLVEPRITDSAWYVVAAPNQAVSLEFAYLLGQDGIATEVENGFDIDGIQLKVRLDFGAGLIDYRGMWKSPD